MTSRDSSADGLSSADRQLVEQIRRGYAPPPMSAVERTRFDARLRDRIERQRRTRWGLAGLALAGVAAAVAFFALRTPTTQPAVAPGVMPEMAATPTAPEAAEQTVALDWLVDDDTADWLGGSTVLPADPLAVPTLDTATTLAAALPTADGADDEGTDDTEAEAADEDGPAWMPEEYTVLAGLIEIDPYDPYAEDWP